MAQEADRTVGLLNGITEVELFGAPGSGVTATVIELTIYNADSVAITGLAQTKVSGALYGGWKFTIAAGETFEFDTSRCVLKGTTDSLVCTLSGAMTTANPTFKVGVVKDGV